MRSQKAKPRVSFFGIPSRLQSVLSVCDSLDAAIRSGTRTGSSQSASANR